jgi:molecular chaperone HtpG
LHIRAKRDGDDEYDLDELLSSWKLKQIVRKYSDHISLPIQMRKEEWDKEKSEQKILDEYEAINQASALWSRSKSEISDAQYISFYKNLSNDFTDPLAHTHNRVEGRTEYTQLLYIPAKAPYDIYDRQNRKGLKLYVRRVFIMDDAEQLLPAYLRFVRGVIDSSDLPLNVSREILQESRDVKAIREGSTKRILSMIDDLAENQKDKFTTFWKEFGQVLKEGLGEDFSNQERLAKLLRFATTTTGDGEQTVSLVDYVARMKEGQDKIYYVTGDSDAGARNSPHLEVFRTKGVEVLLMTDRVDEWMLSFLSEFDGKALTSVARGGLDLGTLETEEEKKQNEQDSADFADLLKSIKDSLADQVKEVRLTHRLTDSPACLVSDDGQISGHLERLLKQSGQKAPARQPILEINPKHPLVLGMKKPQANVQDWSHLLFEQAQLAEGGHLADPAAFVRRMNQMLLAQSQA